MTISPNITFGMIVLNGEPFVAYNLRALYPFAHQIIVVEGASPSAAAIASPDGHSTDGTLEILRRFKTENDPEDKLLIVTAEDEGHAEGFWPGKKDEQSRAYAARASGDYLWQVDVDEFYRAGDMRAVIDMLAADPSITAVSFPQITFWGGFDYCCDGWYLRSGASVYHRLFKWGPGYRYASHRPPTVLDGQDRDLRTLNWMDGKKAARLGIRLYHYSLVFPAQVADKCAYYGSAGWANRCDAENWGKEAFTKLRRPYRVHNVYSEPSWLERYDDGHPDIIDTLRSDIDDGRLKVETRPSADVERLLGSLAYRLGVWLLKVLFPLVRVGRLIRGFLLSFSKLLGVVALIRIWRRWKIARSYPGVPVGKVFSWLWSSRETTNFTYDLTDANKKDLARFVARVTGIPTETAESYISELETDAALMDHIRRETGNSPKRLTSDDIARYGRRLGWYACARALKPKTIVETGVDKGLGACVLAAALRRNAKEKQDGTYFGTDIDPGSGFLFTEPYSRFGKILIGDSVTNLKGLEGPIDFVICDSDHDPDYETREFDTFTDKLSEGAIIFSDNAHATDALERFATRTGRKYLFFREQPKDHWYPGAGIGAAFR